MIFPESRVRTNIQQVNTVEEKIKTWRSNGSRYSNRKSGLAAAETNKLAAYADFQGKSKFY